MPDPIFSFQLLEAETARAIFQDNMQLCNEVTERVIQHFVHCIETHGRHVQYLRFLQTIVKSEGNYIRKCQDLVMAEVGKTHAHVEYSIIINNPSYAKATFVQSTRTQIFWKTIETLSCWYSLDSSR